MTVISIFKTRDIFPYHADVAENCEYQLSLTIEFSTASLTFMGAITIIYKGAKELSTPIRVSFLLQSRAIYINGMKHFVFE